jgi:hypothetical protein
METGPKLEEPAAQGRVTQPGNGWRVDLEELSLEELLYYVLVGAGRRKNAPA